MKECMETDKPLISIVMAVYNPNMDWLREQLLSLNAQDYPNLELHVLDDCSNKVDFSEICTCVNECITAFPYYIDKNSENIGSNKTFEALTIKANGEYIAYCDQDDVWLPSKISVLLQQIKEKNAVLACSDVYIINGEGNKVAESISNVRRRHVFYDGDKMTDFLLFRNFIMGCAMLINSEVAKSAVPFINEMVHDHWLALYASTKGKIAVCKRSLIYYRIHDNNQTNVLVRISSKSEYISIRIYPYYERLYELKNRITLNDTFRKALVWIEARKRYAEGDLSAIKNIWRNRKLNLSTSLFEIIMLKMPNCVFKQVVKIIKSGLL